MQQPFWTTLQERHWDELLSQRWGNYTPPLTSHLPIQAAGSPDLLQVGPAFQVARQRVLPRLNANDLEALRAIGGDETLLVQFAFGQPPAIPDFRRTRLGLQDNRWPLAHATSYSYEGLLYEFEYFSHLLPGDAGQSILWIRGTVSNQKDEILEADIRVQLSFPRENEMFDYHYAPVTWDASKWRPAPEVAFSGDEFTFRGQVVGKVVAPDFRAAWESAAHFGDKDYGEADFRLAPPHDSLRLKEAMDCLHLHQTLGAHQSATFELAFLVNFEAATAAHRVFLREAQAKSSREMALHHLNPWGD